jgi:hypothetical protein
MFELLVDWFHFQWTFNASTEQICPECEDCHLTRDILDDVYRAHHGRSSRRPVHGACSTRCVWTTQITTLSSCFGSV